MTLPVVWLPEAYSELREAVAHYESIRPELAERFAAEVEETIARIAEGPLRYAVVEERNGVRESASFPTDYSFWWKRCAS